MPTERTERTVRREVTEHTLSPSPADTVVEPAEKVVETHVTETAETVPAQPTPKNVNLNVNTDSTPGTPQINVNTPDGTQVNINQ